MFLWGVPDEASCPGKCSASLKEGLVQYRSIRPSSVVVEFKEDEFLENARAAAAAGMRLCDVDVDVIFSQGGHSRRAREIHSNSGMKS